MAKPQNKIAQPPPPGNKPATQNRAADTPPVIEDASRSSSSYDKDPGAIIEWLIQKKDNASRE